MSEPPGIDPRRVECRIRETLGANPEAPWFVAYSGGLDSTVLLYLLAGIAGDAGARLVALHADHEDTASHIRDEFLAKGYAPVEVYAESLVSLNGRAAQAMIDPQADLARTEAGLSRASWITAPPDGPPPLHRPLRLEKIR